MEEFKGTPGPWDFRQDVVNTGFYIETVDQSHKNTFIGDVGGGMQDEFEIRANAQLIAAAPDLLEALLALLPEAEIMINSNHPAHIKAMAAIYKALHNE